MTQPDSPMRIALLGLGSVANLHLDAISGLPHTRIVAACDIAPAVVESRRGELGPEVRTFCDPDEFFEGLTCDYVVIGVPNPLRTPVVLQALRRGIPVLMEKPAAYTMDAFREMADEARRTGTPLVVSQNYRFDASSRLIGAMLRRGEIGDVLSVDGAFFRNHAIAGTLYYGRMEGRLPFRIEMLIHHLDMLCSWIDAEPVSVRAGGWRHGNSWGCGDTGAHVGALFANGTRFTYRGDWAAPVDLTSFLGHWTFIGTKGAILWHDGPVTLLRRHPSDPFAGSGERVEIPPAGIPALRALHLEMQASLREGRPAETNIFANERSLDLCLRTADDESLWNS